MNEPRILIICGSDSDLPTMADAGRALDRLGIGWDLRVSSAHRAPERTAELARTAHACGYSAIIAGAGLAAHLPGVVASFTHLPVIGVPLASGAMRGTDSLHAIVQMPKGIPVATVAIDGAWNAGLLAAQIVAVAYGQVRERYARYRESLTEAVDLADERAQESFSREVAGAGAGQLAGTST